MSEPRGWFRDEARPGPAASPGRVSGGRTWPEQPPLLSSRTGSPGSLRSEARAGGRGPSGLRGSGGGRRRRLRPLRIVAILFVLVLLVAAASGGFYLYLNHKLNRADVLADYSGRPLPGAGQNWLITGSDSRQGLTAEQEQQLATGAAAGDRSDTIMILHIPANGGRAVLVSIPRDSYVPIPGHGQSKINAAFAFGGPALLAQTLQNDTGLYLNHYMGIGFGGFVSVVNAVGGVRMCLPGPMVDPKAGLDLKAGCQTLNGDEALGYVRTRDFALSDLQREQDQRLFLSALLSKLTSAGTLANPLRSVPAADGTVSALTVDQAANLDQLLHVAYALRGPQTTTVPLASLDYQTPSDGVAVLWDHAQASQLFGDLRTDTPLPTSLISGSKAIPTA